MTCAARSAPRDRSRAIPNVDVRPVELRGGERRFRSWIRDAGRECRIAILRKARIVSPPPGPHGVGKRAVEIAEEKEGFCRAPFLAHKQTRRLRTDQGDARQRPHRVGRDQPVQPLAKGAVSHLIMILKEADKQRSAADRRSLLARGRDRRTPRQAPSPEAVCFRRRHNGPRARPSLRHAGHDERRRSTAR